MWVRGLKLNDKIPPYIARDVAPHVGAWIETLERYLCFDTFDVAPHVGAWIETLDHHQC